MNGQERAAENLKAFSKWVLGKSDSDFREIIVQGRLSRGEISRECAFSRSVLTQNPRVKDALRQLEDRLRSAGVLPPEIAQGDAPPLRVRGQLQAYSDAERLRKVEGENAALRAEVFELRRQLLRLKNLDEHVGQTGRLPR